MTKDFQCVTGWRVESVPWRGVLLRDLAWDAAERSLSLDELRRADALMVCNALRGPLPARLQERK